MKLYSLVVAGLMALSTGSLLAQNAESAIVFDKTTHDFGTFEVKAGPQTYEFQFTNKGAAPIIINNVTASCGCTTPGWTKEPIPPGGRGFVKATYNPSGVMPFDKSLSVYSTGSSSPVTLRIKGRVVAKALTVEEQYPVVCGSLRLLSKDLSLARIVQGNSKKDSLAVVNNGASDITLAFVNAPRHLTLEMTPAVLKAGEKGFIRCTFNTAAAKPQAWGIVKYPVGLSVNGAAPADTRLIVAATVEDDNSKVDYKQAPVINVGSTVSNFNTVKQGVAVTAEFELANAGKTPLLIRQAYTENPRLKITAPAAIQPGATAKLKAVLDTAGEEGDKFYSIILTTNAPSQTTATLVLVGTITK